MVTCWSTSLPPGPPSTVSMPAATWWTAPTARPSPRPAPDVPRHSTPNAGWPARRADRAPPATTHLTPQTRSHHRGRHKDRDRSDFRHGSTQERKARGRHYWAEWCGPCRMVAPVLEEIAAEHGDKISVVKLNIDENPQVAQRYGILQIPTLNVFSGGEVVKQVIGAKPKSALLRDLAEFI